MKQIFSLAIMLAITGCAAPKLNTRSGTPEVTIAAPAEKIRARLANDLADHGFAAINSDPLSLVFEKEAGAAASVFFGSSFNPTAYYRARLTLIEDAGSVRVLYHGYIISNRGSGFEKQQEVSGDWQRVQYWLECVAADMESRPRPTEPSKPQLRSTASQKG